jgi:hypothetical protein
VVIDPANLKVDTIAAENLRERLSAARNNSGRS